MQLDSNICYLKGVGPRRAELLARLGVFTLGDLLHLYPRAYEDWRNPFAIADAPLGQICCIRAFVGEPVREHRIRQGMTLYKTTLTDGASTMALTIFNSKYQAQKLKEGEEYLFYGRVGGTLLRRELSAPEILPVSQGAKLRPVYPQTEGLSSLVIAKLIETAWQQELEIPEPIPEALRARYHLLPARDALWNIHFPAEDAQFDAAKYRLAFAELLVLQLGLFRLKRQSKAGTSIRIEADYSQDFLASLPFSATAAQRRAVGEALRDMQGVHVMNRLLQGDVGSGKTAVAAALVDTVVQNGYQCAVMAPTEVLARQHFATLDALLAKRGIRLGLLVGSTTSANKRHLKERLAAGEIDCIIGTHALIQKDVQFARLGFVVTDEQHRFGVNQRAALHEKGNHPHMYVMSATPIPRTLALIIYGDLDVSILDEMPAGRQPIATYAIDSEKRSRALRYVKKHLDRGLQGYIICPMVEENEQELVAAVQYAQALANTEFRDYKVGLLHGRMKPAQKQEVMADFYAGNTQLLVSTTVIEVGVDVPNAVIMVVENAERFGLSQLHQLRGRIGRGVEQSTCILISDARSPQAVERMKILSDSSDGFQIADADLRMRGPGDFFGARQHGLPNLRTADMIQDTQLVTRTQQLAQEILAADSDLLKEENQLLALEVQRLFSTVGETGMN